MIAQIALRQRPKIVAAAPKPTDRGNGHTIRIFGTTRVGLQAPKSRSVVSIDCGTAEQVLNSMQDRRGAASRLHDLVVGAWQNRALSSSSPRKRNWPDARLLSSHQGLGRTLLA